MKTLLILMLVPSIVFGEEQSAWDMMMEMQRNSQVQTQNRELSRIADSQEQIANALRRQQRAADIFAGANYINPDASKSYAEQFDTNQANQLSAEMMRQQIKIQKEYLEMLKRR